jgi:hypothetical protein
MRGEERGQRSLVAEATQALRGRRAHFARRVVQQSDERVLQRARLARVERRDREQRLAAYERAAVLEQLDDYGQAALGVHRNQRVQRGRDQVRRQALRDAIGERALRVRATLLGERREAGLDDGGVSGLELVRRGFEAFLRDRLRRALFGCC